MWEKEEVQNMSKNKRNRCSIRMKIDWYEACLPYTIYCIILYFITIIPPPPPPLSSRFVESLTPGERNSGSIFELALLLLFHVGHNSTRL